MKVAVVTCSRGRPDLLALAKCWANRQTRTPDLHIVSERELPPFEHLAVALRDVPPDHHVVVMEDDDWYSPEHVEVLADELKRRALVASPEVRRVNLPAMRYDVSESLTPGPGMMGIHADMVQHYGALVRASLRGDRIAWEGGPHQPECRSTSVGVKGVGYGLPGIPGSTKKHDPRSPIVAKWTPDPDWGVFRKWLGEDADAYLELLR